MAEEASGKDADASFQKATNRHRPSPLAGMPIGPTTPRGAEIPPVIVRYMYEGGHIGQGRLCRLHPAASASKQGEDGAVDVSVRQVVRALRDDGVDFDTFYACAYESMESTGGWMPLEAAPRDRNPWKDYDDFDGGDDDGGIENDSTLKFIIPPAGGEGTVSRRIDVKLFRRPRPPSIAGSIQSLDDALNSAAISPKEESSSAPAEHSSDALRAISAAVPSGKISLTQGYFGVAIVRPKTGENVGTLWRSAYQLGASVLYTIGGRYKTASADTLNVPARLPLIECGDWSSFVEQASPKGAVWVAVEMGGTPLAEYRHPRNAVYILGSEDHGVPTSVLRGCREVVSLESEEYGSYNVAVAGSIVMYDRLAKQRRRAEREGRAREH